MKSGVKLSVVVTPVLVVVLVLIAAIGFAQPRKCPKEGMVVPVAAVPAPAPAAPVAAAPTAGTPATTAAMAVTCGPVCYAMPFYQSTRECYSTWRGTADWLVTLHMSPYHPVGPTAMAITVQRLGIQLDQNASVDAWLCGPNGIQKMDLARATPLGIFTTTVDLAPGPYECEIRVADAAHAETTYICFHAGPVMPGATNMK